MDTGTIIAIVVVAVVVVVLLAVVASVWRRRGSTRLRERYGSEYDRTVSEEGRRKGEHELTEREKRVAALDIRELSDSEQENFANKWRDVQARFVEAPRTALQHADVLVQQVMEARGFPVGDFEQRAADISVDHAEVASNYREAHAISQRVESATTEEMRQAMLHYRRLFDELLGSQPQTVT